MIIVPTIRNTGSHFVLKMLGVPIPWRPDVFTWREIPKATENSIIFDHVLPHQRKLFLPMVEKHTAIVPLRHPYLTEKSWNDRGMDTDDLVAMWQVMVNDIDPLKPFYLPLDVPDRQDYLDRLNAATGLDLKTDWKPQGVKGFNSELRYQDVTPSDRFRDLCEQFKSFLSRFYP